MLSREELVDVESPEAFLIATELGNPDQLEPHFRQQLRDELLKLARFHSQQPLAQDLPNLVFCHRIARDWGP